MMYICHRWLLGITEYGTVRQWDVYDDLVRHMHTTIFYYDGFIISPSWMGTGYYSSLVVP